MTHPARSVVVHGHFYQPPREDPWTGEVPKQPSAAPYHDWNERIEDECYGPVTRSRVLREGRPPEPVNTLAWMSFDFGPTLLVWLERHAPETHRAIVEADGESARRLGGHGNAMAMPYHHPILPLSHPRDRLTEIRWGMADFRRRFGRHPEGMWLPETAVDGATLDALAGEGIRFTVLAPHQVTPVPEAGRPGRFVTKRGREIALFVYDGRLSHAVAFGDLVEDGVAWADTMASEGAALRSLATDGETFGHHHTFGEMGLAKALVELRSKPEVRLENFASFLAREGTRETVGIVEPSSWSCAHGVDRWRRACGCRIDPAAATHQEWRGPLRSALEWLAEEVHGIFEREGAVFFDDPWTARDAYGEIVWRVTSTTDRVALDPGSALEAVLRPRGSTGERPVGDAPGGRSGTGSDARTLSGRALELLEMERNTLRLFTSCAWFFDDVAGLEPRQVLAYAARALELAGVAGSRLRSGLSERLAEARSNDPDAGTAADVFREVERGLVSGPSPAGTAPRR
ncbi:MAG: DUF3536 domain-containing protein [Longimicrobiales bacterium]|nr:DUF3536 domain-containing protein [Longimicrobiales bacterium]